MSADNGIYILETNDGYRVAEAAAIENFEYYKQKEIHNLGWYMDKVWGRSEVYHNINDAMNKAKDIERDLAKHGWGSEYGIQIIKETEFNFPI